MSQKGQQSDSIMITQEIHDWIQGTWSKYQVNVLEFAYKWVDHFWNNEDLWPATHRRKSQTNFRKYDYDIKQKSILFNLDSLYRKMPKKSFTKGKKQEFETLMMYYWLNTIEGDDSGYWQQYLENTLPSQQPD